MRPEGREKRIREDAGEQGKLKPGEDEGLESPEFEWVDIGTNEPNGSQ